MLKFRSIGVCSGSRELLKFWEVSAIVSACPSMFAESAPSRGGYRFSYLVPMGPRFDAYSRDQQTDGLRNIGDISVILCWP